MVLFKISLVSEGLPTFSNQVFLNFQTYTRPYTLFLDSKNNILLAGQLMYTTLGSGYYQSFLLKFQSSLNDWDCFSYSADYSNNFVTNSVTWTTSNNYVPQSYHAYNADFVEETTRNTILMVSLTPTY